MTLVGKGFFIRLVAGLAISAPIVFRFATAELVDAQPDYIVRADGRLSHDMLGERSRPIRLVASLQALRNSMVLSQAVSSHTSELLWSRELPLDAQSDSTIENVRLAAEAIDLTILQPGEVFSFNETVGIRSEEKGYRPGLMYSNGEVVMGVGGGICIVSTLLYNAALETGLKIIERHPHSGPVSYAEPGRDSAVSFGWADLRFKNNTNGLLFIRAKAHDRKLTVALYGKRQPDQTIEILAEDYEELPYKIIEKEDETVPEGEVRVEQKARPGFAVTIVRQITKAGKIVSREVISRDIQLPRHKIVLVPPKPDGVPAGADSPVPAAKTPSVESHRSSPAPVQGTITVPDEPADEEKAQEEPSPSASPSGASDLTLPTMERTTSTD